MQSMTNQVTRAREHAFLSHAGAETSLALDLAHALKQVGLGVWIDVHDLNRGEPWIAEIEQAVGAASVFVVLVDQIPLRRWVVQELHLALRRDVEDPDFRVLPVLGPGAAPSALEGTFLGSKHAIQFKHHGSWSAVAAAVRDSIAKKDDGALALLPHGQSPFVELRAFGPEDAILFHGREREVTKLLEILRDDQRKLVAVVGNSGSGKSSLVKAGLIPALLRGRFELSGHDQRRWRMIIVRPEREPFESLLVACCDERRTGGRGPEVFEFQLRPALAGPRPVADLLTASTETHDHILLVVDQLEELIQQADPEVARSFVKALMEAIDHCPGRNLKVVLTLRADYFPNILDLGFGQLADTAARGLMALQLPDRDALREAIVRPLDLTKVRFDPGLVDRLLEAVGTGEGSLALLQFALARLWAERGETKIDAEAYERIGGLSGALDQHAEATYQRIDVSQQPLVRRLMVKLTVPDERGRHTRRVVTRSELLGSEGEHGPTARTLDLLVLARLVVARGDITTPNGVRACEVPHEELLRSWKRLAAWLAEDTADELLGRRLRERQKEWVEHGEHVDRVLTPGQLVEAREWAVRRPQDLDGALEVFFAASQRAHESAAERERELGRKLDGLQDRLVLEELWARADELWPPTSELLPDLERWTADARALHGRLERHRVALRELLELEVPNSFLQRTFEELVAGLEQFAATMLEGVDPVHGPGVLRRLDFARTIDACSVTGDDARRRWNAVLADFASGDVARFPAQYRDPLNVSLAGLRPILGLLPWRRDPRSGLLEFVHLWSGELPEVGPAGEFVQTEATGIVLVLIPGGTFLMGAQATDPSAPGYDVDASIDEGPPHEVHCPPFLIGKTTVTQAQWLRIRGENPSQYKGPDLRVGLTNPVESVSWDDCTTWLRRAGLDLPSEARWERAARAGTTTPWWTGAKLRERFNLRDLPDPEVDTDYEILDCPDLKHGYAVHAPAAEFEANPFGLHQVHGNVWEWCRDTKSWYHQVSSIHPQAYEDVPRPSRVVRGGSFGIVARHARSARRYGYLPGARLADLGFRPAQVIP